MGGVNAWHIITCEYPPDVGGVSDYTQQIAAGLAGVGDEVHVWCPHALESASASGVHVHPELGRARLRDLHRLDTLLNQCPAPRRLLVQWVPHGFGYHSMNVWFCAWLATRAWRGDRIELMVHEPFLEFGQGTLRHNVMACVHRLMTMILLRASRHVWMSIPAWEGLLRPYALGRSLPMKWLPIPGCLAASTNSGTAAPRRRYAADEQPLIGHFGSYGQQITSLLEDRLPAIMNDRLRPAMLLVGAGGDRFRDGVIARHPEWSGRVHATGYVPPGDLTPHLDACDLFVQPYPDGISSRRTSAMTCLAHGKPVVTTTGHLTESLWAETGAVVLTSLGDGRAFATAVIELLADRHARRSVAVRGQTVCADRFSVHRVVETLRAA